MAENYSLLDYAEDVLKISDKPLVYQEIWEYGKNHPFFQKIKVTGKTPWQSLGAMLFVDVRDNPKSRFFKVLKNPARFFLKQRKNELSPELLTQIQESEYRKESQVTMKYSEKDLHPLVAYIAYTNNDFNRGKIIFTKTILHEKSKNKGYNEWVHPDMVGFYIPIEDWNETLLEFNTISETNSIKLYSFEIKKKIDKSNYREFFFQSVSNSSWANEGYLVTSFIKEDDDLYSELERLSNSFGIGIIKIDVNDIDASQVVFPARYKKNLDWELMNKLCELNPDFQNFIDAITKDYKVKTIHKDQYDKVIDNIGEYINKLQK